jgi:hypothetical protein
MSGGHGRPFKGVPCNLRLKEGVLASHRWKKTVPGWRGTWEKAWVRQDLEV